MSPNIDTYRKLVEKMNLAQAREDYDACRAGLREGKAYFIPMLDVVLKRVVELVDAEGYRYVRP